jgi:hypothetical protein
MHQELNISRDLRTEYCWDFNIDKLNVDSSRRLIIERVFALGSVKEILLVIDYYGEAEVKKVLAGLNYIDRKSLNFVSKIFSLPLK